MIPKWAVEMQESLDVIDTKLELMDIQLKAIAQEIKRRKSRRRAAVDMVPQIVKTILTEYSKRSTYHLSAGSVKNAIMRAHGPTSPYLIGLAKDEIGIKTKGSPGRGFVWYLPSLDRKAKAISVAGPDD